MRTGLLAIVVLIIVGVAAPFLINMVADFGSQWSQRKAESFQYEPFPQTEPVVDASSDAQDAQPASTEAEAVSETERSAAPEATVAGDGNTPVQGIADAEEADSNARQLEQMREQYASMFAEVENKVAMIDVESELEIPGQRSSLELIELNIAKSADSFADGRLAPAQRFIEDASKELDAVIERNQQYFELNLQAAKDAYGQQYVQQATDAIEVAARLRPDDGEVRMWQDRIQSLPALVESRKNAADYRNAGDLGGERQELEKILSIEPEDGDAKRRLAEVKQTQRNIAFNRAVSRGSEAIGEGDLNRAKTELASMRKLRPASSVTTDFAVQVKRLEDSISVERHLVAARADIAADRWASAKSNFESASAIQATHGEAVTGMRFAQQVLDAQSSLDGMLAHPERLSSPNVAKAARSLVVETQGLGAISARLEQARTSLAAAVESWQTPVTIRVVSDGETDISVKGVGVIGKTTERTLELRPGKYVFEGKKIGYRSKRVNVEIAPQAGATATVTVICDEQI